MYRFATFTPGSSLDSAVKGVLDDAVTKIKINSPNLLHTDQSISNVGDDYSAFWEGFSTLSIGGNTAKLRTRAVLDLDLAKSKATWVITYQELGFDLPAAKNVKTFNLSVSLDSQVKWVLDSLDSQAKFFQKNIDSYE
jgi:hypothetical protein